MPGVADRTGLAYVAESTWGTFPSGPPTLQDLRFTGETLNQETDSTESREISADRKVKDLIRNGVRARGAINYEFSYGTYDDFLKAALFSDAWEAAITVLAAGTASAVNATNKYTHATAWTAIPTANQWIKVAGFATAANNGYSKVASADGTNITVTHKTLADEADKSGVTITQGAYVNDEADPADITQHSFSIERSHSDLASVFEYFTGMMVATMSHELTANGIVTGGIEFLGKRMYTDTSTQGDGSNTAATTTGVMNGIDDVTGVFENATSFDITGLTWNVNNNLRERLQVGTLGAVSVGEGKFQASGTFAAYFANNTTIAKYLAWTSTELAFIYEKSGNGYVFEWPTVKLRAAPANSTAENTDIVANFEWAAMEDATEGITMKVARFPSA